MLSEKKRVRTELEPRQYKNDSIRSKMIPTLKLPRFFTKYTVREKQGAISKSEVFFTEWICS